VSGADIALIHGAWAGPWVWDTIIEPLEAAGHRPHPVSLPGVGDTVDLTKDITLDVLTRTVGDQISSLDGAVVLVGHSGGGAVATQVAEHFHDRVRGVVFVAGFMLPSRGSFGDICTDLGLPSTVGISAYLEYGPKECTSRVPPEAGAAVFFHRAEAAAAVAAARRLSVQQETARLLRPTWTPQRYGRLSRLYVEALHDRSVPLVAQRWMQKLSPGAEVISLDSDHAPQLSAPDELAKSLAQFSSRVSASAHIL
jgi:pimeloyl-ACP methyl ester carboxylesterase